MRGFKHLWNETQAACRGQRGLCLLQNRTSRCEAWRRKSTHTGWLTTDTAGEGKGNMKQRKTDTLRAFFLLQAGTLWGEEARGGLVSIRRALSFTRWRLALVKERRSFQPSAGNSSSTLHISFPHPRLKEGFFCQSAPTSEGHPAPESGSSITLIRSLTASTVRKTQVLWDSLEKQHIKTLVSRYFDFFVCIWKKWNDFSILRLVGDIGCGGWGWPPAEMCSGSFTGVLHTQRENFKMWQLLLFNSSN